MTLQDTLEILARFEESVASFYVWLSAQLVRDDEATQLFVLLAEQEQGHADFLRVTSTSLGEDASMELSLDVKRAVDEVEAMIATYRSSNTLPTTRDALTFALTIEESSAERLGREALADLVPEIRKILTLLDEEDDRHAVHLRELLGRR